MVCLRHSELVRAKPSSTFDFVADCENSSHFLRGFSGFQWTAPRYQPGTRLRMNGTAAGFTLPVELETTEVVPDGRISGVFASGLRGGWEWLFEPAGEDTLVTFAVNYQLPLWAMGLAAIHPLVERDLGSHIRKTLAALKEKLEAGTA